MPRSFLLKRLNEEKNTSSKFIAAVKREDEAYGRKESYVAEEEIRGEEKRAKMSTKRKIDDIGYFSRSSSKIIRLIPSVETGLYHYNRKSHDNYHKANHHANRPLENRNIYHVTQLLQEGEKIPKIHDHKISAFKVIRKKKDSDFFQRLYEKQIRQFKKDDTISVDKLKPCVGPCCTPLLYRYSSTYSPTYSPTYPFQSPVNSPHTIHYSPIQSRRSSETGSANSSGSTCNSCQPEKHSLNDIEDKNNGLENLKSPTAHRKYVFCPGPCCTPNNRKKTSVNDNKRHFIDTVFRHEIKKEPLDENFACEGSCKRCGDNRECIRGVEPNRGPLIPYKRHTNPATYMPHLQSKPLSKRKALMGELEIGKIKEPSLSHTQIENEGNNKEEEKNNSIDLLKIPPGPNRSRAVANLLERRRVAELNTAFENLRDLVPTYGDEDRTLSKIKTLKYALNYMEHLSVILNKQSSKGYFDSKTDFLNLCRKDPLLQKCREHMEKRKVI